PAGVPVPRDHTLAVGEDAETGERPAADLPAERLEDAADLPDRDALLEQAAGGAQQDQIDEVEAEPPVRVARGRDQARVHAGAAPRRRFAARAVSAAGSSPPAFRPARLFLSASMRSMTSARFAVGAATVTSSPSTFFWTASISRSRYSSRYWSGRNSAAESCSTSRRASSVSESRSFTAPSVGISAKLRTSSP